ncbi:hypothetical protein ACF0H5_023906 [Mactra antiquata]
MGYQFYIGLIIVVIATLYQWRPLVNRYDILTEELNEEYDYIVIGGGTAGSVVASRLAEDVDKTVLLLEAGGHFTDNDMFFFPSGWGVIIGSEYDWKYVTEKQTTAAKGMRDNRFYFPRGKVLGGSGNMNGLQYTRGSKFDYDGWAADGCDGWSYKDVLPYFLKSEDIQIDELKSSPYHNIGGPIAVSYSAPSGLSDIFIKAGKELGYHEQDYNGETMEGFSKVQSNIRNAARSSSSIEYLGAKGRKDNLHISVKSFVTKIDITDRTAKGVFFIKNDKKYYIKAAREVIVSAGAINSPQLLMLSGIGPEKELEQHGIKVIQDLPVGQYLKDHQLIVLPTAINQSLSLKLGDLASSWTSWQYYLFKTGPLSMTTLDGSAFLYSDKSKRETSAPDLQVIFFNFLLTENLLGWADSVANDLVKNFDSEYGFNSDLCLTHPYSHGTLTLRSDDPFDPPKINPNFFSDDRDIKTMIAGIRIWEKYIETETMKALGVDINKRKLSACAQYEFRSDDYWECYIRYTTNTEYHHSCTCRMGGLNDSLAVVDPELRVKGITGLRVVDASVFHEVTAGNTNAPTVMVAEKAADMIRGKDTVAEYRDRV